MYLSKHENCANNGTPEDNSPQFDHVTNMTHDEKMTLKEIEEGKRD